MDLNQNRKTTPAKSPNRLSRWLPIALGLGLILSPDNLALLGRFTGMAGLWAPVIIITAAGVYIAQAGAYKRLHSYFPGPAAEVVLVKKTIGNWFALFPLVLRLVAAAFIATGLMVSAGFVFNEVFLYWFPNFGFAFLLLGLLSALHFFGGDFAQKAQLVFVAAAITGLTVLIVVGVYVAFSNTATLSWSGPLLGLDSIFTPLLLFIGFDLAYPLTTFKKPDNKSDSRPMKTIVILAGIILTLWSLTTFFNVSGAKLADTSIAHIITARKILGQSGRVIMAIVVIAGSCSAVNALFIASARMATDMAGRKILPTIFQKIWVLLPAIATAIMMANGVAGGEKLETYIRSIFLMWLGWYALFQISLLVRSQKLTASNIFIAGIVLAITLAGVFMLVLMDPQRVLILKFTTAVLAGTAILGAIFFRRR